MSCKPAADEVTSFSDECGQRQDESTALSSTFIKDVKCESEHVDDKGEDDVLCDLLGSGMFRDADEVDRTLSKHSFTHGAQPWCICCICSEAFMNSGILATHMLTHMHNKPYNNNNNDRLTAFDPGQPG